MNLGLNLGLQPQPNPTPIPQPDSQLSTEAGDHIVTEDSDPIRSEE